ncbi:unnamed protein product [Rotaria socialis]|uniref:Uncharacterized protein n=1 Tax=Rotaria socialis TaxID=392032 RepID=A0A820BSP6_9BILA|nr:unnamed protein product [Rotaria socialis]
MSEYERERHRTTGDWDERKLIEGIIGEKSIYKYRADVPPEPGSPQTKAKRLRLVVNLSASMYRFNGVDNRLERQCECVLMFLESLAGFEHKFTYDIVGHSGDEHSIELIRDEHESMAESKSINRLLVSNIRDESKQMLTPISGYERELLLSTQEDHPAV